ncbi:PEP-CTERM sorting domain-containing protein [Geobacter chapellei]|uniref:PEP-CTERM sorting domain-containing protein n=2 Tax=Pelotalea chapellei TaxID=44671 RepID=A0ABS5U818_9BACT|nr:PEP-CTERM sorting domain-containing protein [Pelotalea chapellei]
MASLPEEWRTNWDLTSWNSVMNGNFALMQASSYLQTSTNFTTTIPLSSSSRPISLSYDYAVASDALNSPYNTVAYFRLELVAKNFNESRKYYLVYSEPMWSATPQKQVFTGTVKLSEDYFLRGIGPTAESYDEQFEIWVSFWNPFGYNYIVGIDNIDLEVLPANSNAAPVPEPASCILLVAGLAGVGIYARRKRSMKLA